MREQIRRALFATIGASATMGGAREGGPFGLAPRALASLREGLWAFLGQALSADEKSRLGVALYDASTEYRAGTRHEWEDAWHHRWLPPPPAHVLVGGAGAGREVRALLERGIAVTAIEPSHDLANECRRTTDGRVAVIEARYEDIASGRVLSDRRFDAVLLGLGSLSHVLDATVRIDLMRMLARLCDCGPVLVSVLAPPSGASPMFRLGRAARAGRALATPFRAIRRLPPVDAGEIPFGGLGFARLFTRPDLVSLGASVGRRACFDPAAPDGIHLCAFVTS